MFRTKKRYMVVFVLIVIGSLVFFSLRSAPTPARDSMVVENGALDGQATTTDTTPPIETGSAPSPLPGTTENKRVGQVATSAPVRSTPVVSTVPVLTPPFKRATATVFWVGEGESSENGYIHNRVSAWDEAWETHFGGYDDPLDRCGYRPCDFVPKQNPFYVALPYIERNDDETVKVSARSIPWYSDALFREGVLLQDHWVEVRAQGERCFAQWKDVGPFETDDFDYVFGSAPTPANHVDARAGIDLSPALRDCLQVGDVSLVEWRFADGATVPPGPWRDAAL